MRHPSLKRKKSELRVRKSAAALPRRNLRNRQSDAKRRRLRPLIKGAGFAGGSQLGLAGGGLTRLVIGQSLAFDALKHFGRALVILDAELGTIVVSKIELGEIAMQVRLAD